MTTSIDPKRRAGETAVDTYVRDGMCVGLGTGSTAYWAIHRVGERIAAGEKISAVATSVATEQLCREARIPLFGLTDRVIDVAIDGADEVAADLSLTKGAGGALFREKSVAIAAKQFVCIVGQNKLVEFLGAFPTPVEVVPFNAVFVAREIERRFPHAHATGRVRDGSIVRTDNGNVILDCHFGKIDDPGALDRALREIHGVVASGLFVGLTDVVLVASDEVIRTLTPAKNAR